MIVIPMDLIAYSGPQNDCRLGTLVICNDGTGTFHRGNYGVRMYRKGVDPIETVTSTTGRKSRYLKLGVKPMREARVENYARNSRPVWDLVMLALKALGY